MIGRFHFLERVQGKVGYLAYLPAVYAVAYRSLRALPEGRDALPVLARWVPELAPEAQT